MNNEEDIIDVEYQDIGNEIYLTAPQLAQKINDTDIRVRHWADVFGDLIGIEKLNGRKRYKESDVYKFAFIKDLLDNKNFKHDQAKVYISKHGFKYAEFDSGLIDPRDPLGFQALASALSVGVDEKLKDFTIEIKNDIANILTEFLTHQNRMNTEMKAEIEASVDSIVEEKMNESISKIESHQAELKDYVATTITETIDNSLDSKLSAVTENLATQFKFHIDERELEYQRKDQERIDFLNNRLEEQRQQYLREQEEKANNKGFFGKLFGK